MEGASPRYLRVLNALAGVLLREQVAAMNDVGPAQHTIEDVLGPVQIVSSVEPGGRIPIGKGITVSVKDRWSGGQLSGIEAAQSLHMF